MSPDYVRPDVRGRSREQVSLGSLTGCTSQERTRNGERSAGEHRRSEVTKRAARAQHAGHRRPRSYACTDLSLSSEQLSEKARTAMLQRPDRRRAISVTDTIRGATDPLLRSWHPTVRAAAKVTYLPAHAGSGPRCPVPDFGCTFLDVRFSLRLTTPAK